MGSTIIKKGVGLLPADWPGFLATMALGFQHFVAIFPATVLVPALVGFNVSTTLLVSGMATLLALMVTKGRIPLYYGSSFSVIAPIMVVMAVNGGGESAIRIAQVGILAGAVIEVAVGFWVMKVGPEKVYKILPPIVTGPIAMIIAFSLASAAVGMASGMSVLKNADGQSISSMTWWLVAFVTWATTIIWSKTLKGKGLLGMLPILGGATVGYLVSIPLGLVNLAPLGQAAFLRAPRISLPNFSSPGAIGAILAIAPAVIAQIPESLSHLVQVDGAVQRIAKKSERTTPSMLSLVGLNQIADGVGDIVCGLLGGTMGTNYGETISTIIASGSATIFAIVFAALFAIVSSFNGHIEALVGSIPTAVTGGLALYLFGAFGAVGIEMLKQVEDLQEPENVAVLSIILMLGLGGIAYGGILPIPLPAVFSKFLPGGVPAIATAAFVGIATNALLKRAPGIKTKA